MNLVLHQKREPYLLSISLMYLDLYRQYKNIVLVKVITAISIGTEIVEKIRTQLIKELETQIMMEQIVDPSIQGGFILDLNNNYRFDASVSTQLKKIRKQLIESDAKIV
jgi:F-type H+-transporting ATPase subunit delta